jgi:hypothetical protein
MTSAHYERLCNGVPVDHRLASFLQRVRLTQTNVYASHADLVEDFASLILRENHTQPTEEEVQFAKWMAKPDNQGGVLIALMQPAQYQTYYTEDHYRTMNECASLAYLNETINFIIGSGGINTVSVFDAFPYITNKIKDNEGLSHSADLAYKTFLNMVEIKKPAVVFGGWNTKAINDPFYASTGVGTQNEPTHVQFPDGHRITVVNGFHPSYAANFIPYESCFRRLFTLELTKAFGEANNSWSEQPWMSALREKCQRRVKQLIERKLLNITVVTIELTDCRGLTVV